MSILESSLNAAIARNAFPCAALALQRAHCEPEIVVAGNHTYEGSRALRVTDLFDLASLTKVIITTSLLTKFCIDGLLSLENRVAEFLPDFMRLGQAKQSWRAAVNVAHLLAHCAGLPAGVPFYRFAPQRRSQFRQLLCEVELCYEPGTNSIYSDVSFMLLGEIIQEVSGASLNELATKYVFQPCGMASACYNPSTTLRPDCVPTELRNDLPLPWQGVVHDENARWLGGMAAHAGLFGSIRDICAFARALLEKRGLFDNETYTAFTHKAGLVPGSSRCLGWDSPTINSSSGGLFSEQSFGHAGFTGTSLWFDTQRQLAIILLSNAVYPRRECKEVAFVQERRKIYDQVMKYALRQA